MVLQLGFTVYVIIILLVACVFTVEFLTIELLVHLCPFPKERWTTAKDGEVTLFIRHQ